MILHMSYANFEVKIAVVEAKLDRSWRKLFEVGPSWISIGCKFTQVRTKVAQIANKLAWNENPRPF